MTVGAASAPLGVSAVFEPAVSLAMGPAYQEFRWLVQRNNCPLPSRDGRAPARLVPRAFAAQDAGLEGVALRLRCAINSPYPGWKRPVPPAYTDPHGGTARSRRACPALRDVVAGAVDRHGVRARLRPGHGGAVRRVDAAKGRLWLWRRGP